MTQHAHVTHRHDTYTVAALEAHLQNWHDDDDQTDGMPHTHESPRGKANAHYSDRIDMHPRAVGLLPDAEVIFFGIEGCPKADAMLADIIRNGWSATVMSVPSVSMWNAPELPLVAHHVLRGRTVIIVPDADGVSIKPDGTPTNSQVLNQALIFQSRLYAYGVRDVLIAAPPLDKNGALITVLYDGEEEKLKGVDDMLGLSDLTLADLAVYSYVPPTLQAVLNWLYTNAPTGQRQRAHRIDAMTRRADVIRALATCGGPSGQFSLTLTLLARFMDVRVQRVSETVEELVTWNVIEVEGNLRTNQNRFNGALEWAGDSPTITLIPELRAQPKDDGLPLSVVLPGVFGNERSS